jgi:DNA end-binding protein Ku
MSFVTGNSSCASCRRGAPDGQVGQDAFAVIREAMRGKDMVALGRVVLAKRERVIMLQPWDKGLMGTTLRYPYEIRHAKELISTTFLT